MEEWESGERSGARVVKMETRLFAAWCLKLTRVGDAMHLAAKAVQCSNTR